MNDLKVTIIGLGFVGLSLSVVYGSKKISVNAVDIDKEKIKDLQKGKSPFFEPDLDTMLQRCIKSKTIKFHNSVKQIEELGDVIFLTVPTPNRNGKIDLSFLKSSLDVLLPHIQNSKTKPVVIVKSTIAPGTTKNILLPIFAKFFKELGSDFHLAINPEFLREGYAINDQKNPHVIVLGTEDNKTKTKLNSFFKKIYPKHIPIVNTNFTTSELIKYSNNAFLATKISFINSISNLCQQIPGANVDKIAKVIGMDSRIGPLFLKAGPGFGGSCLPKDLESLISVCKKYNIDSNLFDSVKYVNDQQITKILKILKNKIPKLSNKTISIFGLSFKENSDDIRASKSIELIENLLNSNCKIHVYDKLAIPNTKKVFKNNISYFNSKQKCVEKSDCLILMHSGKEFETLSKSFFKKMKTPLVLDTRRVLKIAHTEIEHIQIGVNS